MAGFTSDCKYFISHSVVLYTYLILELNSKHNCLKEQKNMLTEIKKKGCHVNQKKNITFYSYIIITYINIYICGLNTQYYVYHVWIKKYIYLIKIFIFLAFEDNKWIGIVCKENVMWLGYRMVSVKFEFQRKFFSISICHFLWHGNQSFIQVPTQNTIVATQAR